jgi:hypothetical protein
MKTISPEFKTKLEEIIWMNLGSEGMGPEEKQLLKQVRSLIRSARQIAACGVNSLQVMTNFEIGRLIIEHEQEGRKRSELW